LYVVTVAKLKIKKKRNLLKAEPATAQCVDVHVHAFRAGVD